MRSASCSMADSDEGFRVVTGGSSPKLCQTFYRRRTEVWGMDLSEVGAEFGSCGD
eukprot:COSAG02_NODE_13025_length_1457_cov_1.726269_1_plen_54_part_10